MPYIPEPGVSFPPGRSDIGKLMTLSPAEFELLAQTLQQLSRRSPLPPPKPPPAPTHRPPRDTSFGPGHGPQYPPGYRRKGYPWEGNVFLYWPGTQQRMRDRQGNLLHPDAPPILGRKLRG